MKKKIKWIGLALLFAIVISPIVAFSEGLGSDLGSALKKTDVTPGTGGLMSVPGFDFLMDRVKNHGYYGRAWDIKGRPSQTIVLTMNDNGPLYISAGLYQDLIPNEWFALGGLQYDFFYAWDKMGKWGPLKRMGLVKLPDDWKLLGGPLGNLFRVTPNNLRIDRDVLWNLAFHIPLGKSSEGKK